MVPRPSAAAAVVRPVFLRNLAIRQGSSMSPAAKVAQRFAKPHLIPDFEEAISNPLPRRKIAVVPPPPSELNKCKFPLNTHVASQLAILDPTGQRRALFAKDNEQRARVGDILMVKFKSGEPFSGVMMDMRRRGVDSSILLRNHLTKVGVELLVKLYSPNIQGIEIVQRAARRARRARLTYLRKPEHDIGSVEKIVIQYKKAGRTLQSENKSKKAGAGAQGKTVGKAPRKTAAAAAKARTASKA